MIVTLASEEKESIQKASNGKSLMAIVQDILEDPEFMSLREHDQLRILNFIYDMLEEYHKRKFSQLENIKNNSKYCQKVNKIQTTIIN